MLKFIAGLSMMQLVPMAIGIGSIISGLLITFVCGDLSWLEYVSGRAGFLLASALVGVISIPLSIIIQEKIREEL